MMSMTKLDANGGDWRGTEFAQHVKDLWHTLSAGPGFSKPKLLKMYKPKRQGCGDNCDFQRTDQEVEAGMQGIRTATLYTWWVLHSLKAAVALAVYIWVRLQMRIQDIECICVLKKNTYHVFILCSVKHILYTPYYQALISNILCDTVYTYIKYSHTVRYIFSFLKT